MNSIVQPDSLITLRYRIASDGTDWISTFGSAPATLQLGNDELAPALEQCLVGLKVDERREFILPPEKAFGKANSKLIQRMPRQDIPASISPTVPPVGCKPGTQPGLVLHGSIEFSAPSGQTFTGIVRELDAETVVVDFNHPLAGKTVCFDVEIIGIL